MRILTTNDMEQKLEYKKLTTEEHGESRKEKTFIKLLEKNISSPCYSVIIRGGKRITSNLIPYLSFNPCAVSLAPVL